MLIFEILVLDLVCKDPPNIDNILSFKIFKISVLISGLQDYTMLVKSSLL